MTKLRLARFACSPITDIQPFRVEYRYLLHTSPAYCTFPMTRSVRYQPIITSLVPRPSFHGVPVRGPGNNSQRMRLIKTARYA